MRRLLLLPLLLLAACGSDGPSDADRAFVAGMVPHHEGAIEMAQIAQERAQSPFVEGLAADILRTQSQEIEALRAEVPEPGEAGGTGGHTMMDPSSLRTAEPFDEAFLRMMVPHHEEAVTMARTYLEDGDDPELRELARAILDAQEREIAAMRAELR